MGLVLLSLAQRTRDQGAAAPERRPYVRLCGQDRPHVPNQAQPRIDLPNGELPRTVDKPTAAPPLARYGAPGTRARERSTPPPLTAKSPCEGARAVRRVRGRPLHPFRGSPSPVCTGE